MSPLRRLMEEWRRRLFAGRREAAAPRLRVRNLTRERLLGAAVEVAASSARRNKGLLGRKGLAPGEGLWIVPCEAVHTFGMKFPLDLVYLDRSYRVVKARSNVAPNRISGCLLAHSVLELAAGTLGATQTRKGDRLELLPAPAAAEPLEPSAAAPYRIFPIGAE